MDFASENGKGLTTYRGSGAVEPCSRPGAEGVEATTLSEAHHEQKTRLTTRHSFTALTVIMSLLLSVYVFISARNQDILRIREYYRDIVAGRDATLRGDVEDHLSSIRALKAFLSGSGDVSRSSFREFVESISSDDPGVQVLAWIPRVSRQERPVYEERARRHSFKGFRITELGSQGDSRRADDREECFPAYFVEPYAGNERYLGFDCASSSTLMRALESARDTGDMVAAEPLDSWKEPAGRHTFAVFAPIYRKGFPADTPETRRENLQGFVAGFFRVAHIVDESLAGVEPAGINYSIYDEFAPKERRLLYEHRSRVSRSSTTYGEAENRVDDTSLKFTAAMNVAGRQWRIVYTVVPEVAALRRTWQPWGILFLCLLSSGVLAGILIGNARHLRKLSGTTDALRSEIEDRKKAEEALVESEERYRMAIEESNDGVSLLQGGRHIYVNPKFLEMFGYDRPDDVLGKNRTFIAHPDDREMMDEYARKRESGEPAPPRYEFRGIRKDGTTIYVEISPVRVIFRHEPVILTYLRDVTDRKIFDERLQTMAINDELTGLYNRRGFFALCQQQLKASERSGKELLLFFADLDDLKWINDTLGHVEGDRALAETATVLKETFRESDVLGRVGGDEFAILADTTAEKGEMLIGRLKECLRSHNRVKNGIYELSLSVGRAHYDPVNPVTFDTLFTEADARMYEQKRMKCKRKVGIG